MDFPKTYDPHEVEPRIWKLWEDGGFFKGQRDESKKPFCVVIPPPNVTGVLHIGHVLDNTPQDIIVRYKRMNGFAALWLPGTDHAGIATQNVVKQALDADGLDYRDLGREGFLEKVWDWKEHHGSTIIRQLKRLGCSCDFSRERFTMDEGLSNAVEKCFLTLHERGLIYKGPYMINWCVRCHTALSDDEVEHVERGGNFWYIKYPLVDGTGEAIVATTRPETMLGDTAIAVHPEPEKDLNRRLSEAKAKLERVSGSKEEKEARADVQRLEKRIEEYLPRLKEVATWVGRRVLLPLTVRTIPIIADEYVKTDLGTGMLKVTPAHDPNDYEIGKRHGLDEIAVIGFTGRMTDEAPIEYRGLERIACRRAIEKDLDAQGFLEKKEQKTQSIGVCYRCEQIVEPLISEQWFVRMKPLAEKAKAAVESGDIKIIPKKFEANYFHWMNNVRDWCISRQLWWGHRIPAWYLQIEGEELPRPEPKISAKEPPLPDDAPEGSRWIQDEDVLDTWFSSWLWPFSTLGWPDEDAPDYKFWYPTTWLNSGKDILFFWDARMIMAGLEFTGRAPFSELYLHGIARDEQGRKISKSLGNSPDVLNLIDTCGADSLRMAITSHIPAGEDIRLSDEVFDFGRHFCNKLWNACRLIFTYFKEGEVSALKPEVRTEYPEDRWIESRLQSAIKSVSAAIEVSEFNRAAHHLHSFFWSEFCDWYLEIIKPRLATEPRSADGDTDVPSGNTTGMMPVPPQTVRAYTESLVAHFLGSILKLLHPMIPYITEEIWQILRANGLNFEKGRGLLSISVAEWPSFEESRIDLGLEDRVESLFDVVRGVRRVRADMNIERRTALTVSLILSENFSAPSEREIDILKNVGFIDRIDIVSQEPEGLTSALVAKGLQAFVHLSGVIDVEKESARLKKKLGELERGIDAADKKLSNPGFVDRAPEEVVRETKDKRDELARQKEQVAAFLASLQGAESRERE
ncbi:MAG: valine--tRNA ligase [Planctomycetes bacterium]|nr:valine--tRNA ligase [Planctomycetota bacterium]